MKLTQQEQIKREELDETYAGYSGETLNLSLGNTLPHTAISLPRLNVVVEGEKSSSDPTSSAKLVLSNLASGTLILSPVNIAANPHLLNTTSAPDTTSCSSLLGVSETNQSKKTLEASESITNFYSSSETSAVDDSESIRRRIGRSSSVDKHFDCGDTRLPHKLRFKHSLRASVD